MWVRDWIADYEIRRPFDDPLRPARRAVAVPPIRLGLPEDEVLVEIGAAGQADVLPSLTRWAAAAGQSADASGGPPARGLTLPLEAGPLPADDGGPSRTWVTRRAVVGAAPDGTPVPLGALAGAATGLAALHGAGGIHGAITPGRILTTSSGGLLDLPPLDGPSTPGLVCVVDSAVELDTVAPEVLRGEPPAAPSDVWSLAACVHRARTGRLVHTGLASDLLLTAVQRVIAEWPSATDTSDLGALTAACLSPDPGGRPAAAELAAALTEVAGSL